MAGKTLDDLPGVPEAALAVVVQCGECEHFSPATEWWDTEDEEDGKRGSCTAWNKNAVPHAWRWATREVEDAYSRRPICCPVFKQKNKD